MIDTHARTESAFPEATLIMGASLFIALAAQFRVQLPFSPVPITAQTLAVLLTGALLGAKRGSSAVLLYLLEGLLGLPVFAGASSGLASLFGPTGGYLVGFAGGAYITGMLMERGWSQQLGTSFAALALGNVLIYACGLSWLTMFASKEVVLSLGLWPFIPGDFFKLICATAALFAGSQARKEDII